MRLSASDQTPERTHRVGDEWTGSSREWTESSRAVSGKAGCAARVGQGRVAEQHVENKRRSAYSPKELNRPSRTISHHRARAGENATDPRNQPRVASEKERSPALTEKHTKPQLDATPAESAQSTGESTSDLPEDARFSTTREPSTPILTSSPFTFMIPDGICLFKSWKEIKYRIYARSIKRLYCVKFAYFQYISEKRSVPL